MSELVTIAAFSTPVEANLARSALDAEGIVAFLEGEATVGNFWYLGTAVGGVKLRVAERDAERASAILDAAATQNPAAKTTSPGHCPQCGAEIETGFDVCWSCCAKIGDSAARSTKTTTAKTINSTRGSAEDRRPTPVVASPDDIQDAPKSTESDEDDSQVGDSLALRAWRAAALAACFYPSLLWRFAYWGWWSSHWHLMSYDLFLVRQQTYVVRTASIITSGVVVLLGGYSIWMLMHLSAKEYPLSSRGKRHFLYAAVIDNVMLGLFVLFLYVRR